MLCNWQLRYYYWRTCIFSVRLSMYSLVLLHIQFICFRFFLFICGSEKLECERVRVYIFIGETTTKNMTSTFASYNNLKSYA